VPHEKVKVGNEARQQSKGKDVPVALNIGFLFRMIELTLLIQVVETVPLRQFEQMQESEDDADEDPNNPD